jgi:hypothetical protein
MYLTCFVDTSIKMTEYCGLVVRIRASYSEGLGFESQATPTEVLQGLLSHFSQIL